MTHVSLFSGIGGIDLAAEWAGFRTIQFVEKDLFCGKVLRKHWPEVPIHDDITTFTGNAFRGCDLLTGGFPCQPYSHAGKRKGAGDDRALWPEMFRVIRECQPAWIVGENVAGFVGMGLDSCLSDLESEGYETGAFLLPACGVGAPHQRYRVFIVANHTGHGRGPGWTRGSDPSGTRQSELAFSDVEDANCGGLPEPGVRAEQPGRTEALGASETLADSARDMQPRTTAQRPFGERVGERGESIALADSERIHDDRCGYGASEVRGQQSGQAEVFGSGQWEFEPNVGRVAHGVPNRVDRLRALGNAVVPQQVYPILKAIAEAA